MCVSIENRSSSTFTKASIKNDELRNYANVLAKDAMNIRANLLHMSSIMAQIASKRDTGILEEFDGSIVVFAEQRLGIKKSQVYSMVQVGATFLDSNGKSILTEKGGKWSNTQFMALLPMAGTGKNKKDAAATLGACQALVDMGKIKPSMTVAEIKEVVAVERPDAKVKAEKAEKREKEKQENEKQMKKVQAKIKGTCIANIQIWELSDGAIYVTFDGEEKEFDTKNLSNIVKCLSRARNYKKSDKE